MLVCITFQQCRRGIPAAEVFGQSDCGVTGKYSSPVYRFVPSCFLWSKITAMPAGPSQASPPRGSCVQTGDRKLSGANKLETFRHTFTQGLRGLSKIIFSMRTRERVQSIIPVTGDRDFSHMLTPSLSENIFRTTLKVAINSTQTPWAVFCRINPGAEMRCPERGSQDQPSDSNRGSPRRVSSALRPGPLRCFKFSLE